MNKKMLLDPCLFIALGAGSGLSPKAPGTMGTLATFPLYYICDYFLSHTIMLALAIFFILIGIPLCSYANKQLGTHDSGAIVWDEIAAFFIILLFTPADWYWQLVAFGSFRFFDIVKPPPIKWLDKNVHGGIGVMLDDVVAALFSITLLQIAIHLIAG